jgi:hypothetical protein
MSDSQNEKLLRLNRECQAALRAQLERVTKMQAANSEAAERVRLRMNRTTGRQIRDRDPHWRPFDRYFVDEKGKRPPDNSDVASRREWQQQMPQEAVRRWAPKETENLRVAVKQALRELAMQQGLLENEAADIEAHNSRKELINNWSAAELERQYLGAMTTAKWEVVQKSVNTKIKRGNQKTIRQCRVQYLKHEADGINHGPWTSDEEQRLVSIAEKHLEANWQVVADDLGTGRLPIHCLRRYQTKHNKSLKRVVWTKEEDQLLCQAVERCGLNWHDVAACLVGRTNQQCLQRWYHSTHGVAKKRGVWTLGEDRALQLSVHAYTEPELPNESQSKQQKRQKKKPQLLLKQQQPRWGLIQAHVAGRVDAQCRERWSTFLPGPVHHPRRSKGVDPQQTAMPARQLEQDPLLPQPTVMLTRQHVVPRQAQRAVPAVAQSSESGSGGGSNSNITESPAGPTEDYDQCYADV